MSSSKAATIVSCLEGVVIRQLPLSVVWKVSSQGSYHCQLFGRCRHKAATIVSCLKVSSSKAATIVSCLEGVVIRQLPLSVVWKVSSQGSYHCQLFGRCRLKAATIVSCLEGVVIRQLPLSVVWKVSSTRQLPLSVVWKVSSQGSYHCQLFGRCRHKAATIVSCLEVCQLPCQLTGSYHCQLFGRCRHKAATIVSCLEGVVSRQLPLSVVWKVSSSKAATIVSCLEGVVSRQLPLSVVWKVSS